MEFYRVEIEGGCWSYAGEYVETFWLPVLGPTAWVLIRRVNQCVDDEFCEFTADVDRLARSCGVSTQTIERALLRLVMFSIVDTKESRSYGFPEFLPPLPKHQLRRHPEWLRALHATVNGAWT